MNSTEATPKQVNYIRALLSKTGVASPGEQWLGAWAKPWLTQRERSGRLDSINKAAASKLIDGLRTKAGA